MLNSLNLVLQNSKLVFESQPFKLLLQKANIVKSLS